MTLPIQTISQIEKFFKEIPDETLSRFVSEIEWASDVGEPDPLADAILEHARRYARAEGINLKRGVTPMRAICEVIEPYLVTEIKSGLDFKKQPARICRTSLDKIWKWIERDLMPNEYPKISDNIRVKLKSENEAGIEELLDKSRLQLAEKMDQAFKSVWSDERQKMRLRAQMGGDQAFHDAIDIVQVFKKDPHLEELKQILPKKIPEFTPHEVDEVLPYLDKIRATNPTLLPFAMSKIMARLQNPTQICRIPIRCVGSERISDIEVSEYSLVLDLLIFDTYSKMYEILQALRFERERPLFSRIIHEYAELIRGIKFDIELTPGSKVMTVLTQQCGELSRALKLEIERTTSLINACLRLNDPFNRHDDEKFVEADFALGLLEDCRKASSVFALNETIMRVRHEVESLLVASGDMVVRKLRDPNPEIRETASSKLSVAVQLTKLALGEESAHLLEKSGFSALSASERTVRKA